MSEHVATIHPGEIPLLDHTDMFQQAATHLAAPNSAILLPEVVESPFGPVTAKRQQLNALLHALSEVSPTWLTLGGVPHASTPDGDLGMHNNPYNSVLHPSLDWFHFHTTVAGSGTVTMAAARPEYLGDEEARRRLTDLLQDGKTDTRFADPDSFRQAQLESGVTVVFRLFGPTPTDFAQLHAFQTTSPFRLAEIIRLARVDRIRTMTMLRLGPLFR